MRVKVKRMIVVSVALMLMLPLVLGLVGCSTLKVYTSGYFEYIITNRYGNAPQGEEKYVSIVGFSEVGREQEVLDIPREIEGMEVFMLGGQNGFLKFSLESEKLKKLYIHENIKSIYNEAIGKLQDLEIMYCGFNIESSKFQIMFTEVFSDWMNIYIYIYTDLYKIDEDFYGIRNVGPANIEFLNNYSTDINGGYYMLDNIGSGERIPEPISPSREGYSFMGWYVDSDLTQRWNFNNTIDLSEDEVYRLYGSWQRK
jgi:uncharacterized repeat protein (TIGR02543 family)